MCISRLEGHIPEGLLDEAVASPTLQRGPLPPWHAEAYVPNPELKKELKKITLEEQRHVEVFLADCEREGLLAGDRLWLGARSGSGSQEREATPSCR